MDIVTNQLIEDNLKLVWYVINEFTNRGYTKDNLIIDEEDLYQIGCMGLTKAAKSFDKKKGASFSSFAVTCIRNEIYAALSYQSNHEDIKDLSFDKGLALDDASLYLESSESTDAGIMLEGLIDELVLGLTEKSKDDAKKILMLMSMGYREREAAKMLKMDPARAYRLIRKIRLLAK